MRETFMAFALLVVTLITTILGGLVKAGERFCISVDEWTSCRNKRYMAVILHTQAKRRFTLALRKIDGACPATKAKVMIENVLSKYGLDVKRHIVCIVSDGKKT